MIILDCSLRQTFHHGVPYNLATIGEVNESATRSKGTRRHSLDGTVSNLDVARQRANSKRPAGEEILVESKRDKRLRFVPVEEQRGDGLEFIRRAARCNLNREGIFHREEIELRADL